jgi:acyl-CoA thioesterase-1
MQAARQHKKLAELTGSALDAVTVWRAFVERVRPSRLLFIVAITFQTALLFNGCSQNAPAPQKEERAEAVQSSQPAPAPPDNRQVIVAFGDSLTAGVSGKSYPESLQSLLDEAGFKYRVENQGVSGDTTTDGLARIDNVIAAGPALVMLEFGGNDGLRGVPIDATRDNLERMIQHIQAAKIPLVLLGITLPPNYGPDYVKPFTAIFPDLAGKYKIKLMPFLLLHVYQNRSLMQPDGIHPNETGNVIVAQDVLHLIQPQLKK